MAQRDVNVATCDDCHEQIRFVKIDEQIVKLERGLAFEVNVRTNEAAPVACRYTGAPWQLLIEHRCRVAHLQQTIRKLDRELVEAKKDNKAVSGAGGVDSPGAEDAPVGSAAEPAPVLCQCGHNDADHADEQGESSFCTVPDCDCMGWL